MGSKHYGNVGGETDADVLASRSVTDGATTLDSTTVTSATANFTARDVGATIAGSGIPAGATITAVTDASTVTISAAATATATAVTLTFGDQVRMSSPALASLPAIASPDFVWICMDPDGVGGGAPEWMKITAHTNGAATATITRAEEGSAARLHRSGIEWVHTPSPSELDTLGTAPATAWTAYTPTWTAVTTNPTIGDGTLTGAYTQIGKTVHFRVNLTFGSTTAVGSGLWRFGLPVPAHADLVLNHGINVGGYAEDAAVQGYMIGAARMNTASAIELIYHSTASSGAAAIIASASPFAWANGDYLRFSGTYEAA